MKLYFSPFACSLAARIAIYEAKLDCEFVRVNLNKKVTESGIDFWTITDKGKVSALALDSGRVLTENFAVLQYIADQAAPGSLIPVEDREDRYEVISWLSFVTSEIHKMGVYPLASPHFSNEMKAITNELVQRQLTLVTPHCKIETIFLEILVSPMSIYSGR
ncbi:glutathione transferase GstA [Microbulbifer echini]|uniref:Glutathione transferase GstA n=1 Tax=Microbulbifer echini TaxID=1529067 RepID=A0ABV4NNU0_9GAMM